MIGATLRVARASGDLAALVHFYCTGLGYDIIASFTDHAGFDGIMFGLPGAAYHLEFTRQHGTVFAHRPDPEDLLVFYLPDRGEWQAALERMESAGYRALTAHNPYWDHTGRTFADPEGRRVVLQNAAWP